MKEITYHGFPVSLALLADLHNTDPALVISSLRSHAPSLIAITGDVLYGSAPVDDVSPLEKQENVLPFFQACSSIAPTFLSLGNHEWMLDRTDLAAISATGVTVLDNSWITTVVDGKNIVLAGLSSGYVTDYRAFRETTDGSVRYPKKEGLSGISGVRTEHKPDTGWLEQFATQPGMKICLSHHPEYYPHIPSSIDLILSGHAHGEQWRMYNPFKREWTGTWSPGQGWWPRYTKGVYDGRMVVSAGLSNTTWVPRIGNPTEVVYLEH